MRRGSRDHRARLAYQEQDSALTLAEGLEQYYAANVGTVIRPNNLPPESAALFRSHDVCHVIFGLNTSLTDEALADARTLLSCDVGVRRYVAYLAQDKQAKAQFKELGYGKALWALMLALPRILRAAIASWQMPVKWPWEPPAEFQHRSLHDLRIEYGIRVV